MLRRAFITVIAGSAATWPLAARAQKSSSVRRVGVLMSTASDDPIGQANSAAFAQGLQQLGWEIGSNIRIDYRWGAGDTERFRKYAAELVGLSPDVILGTAASIVRALQEASRTIDQRKRNATSTSLLARRVGGASFRFIFEGKRVPLIRYLHYISSAKMRLG